VRVKEYVLSGIDVPYELRSARQPARAAKVSPWGPEDTPPSLAFSTSRIGSDHLPKDSRTLSGKRPRHPQLEISVAAGHQRWGPILVEG